MIQIKKTKSVSMEGDEKKVQLHIHTKAGVIDTTDNIFIPMKAVFQVKRGLESYVQHFYRKHIK